jgi:hypothetical protein
MAAKLTTLTHKIAIQLYPVAESCTICSSRSRRPVRKILDTPSCTKSNGITDQNGWSDFNLNNWYSTPRSITSNAKAHHCTRFWSSSTHIRFTTCVPKIHLNTILPSAFRISKWTFSKKFPYQNYVSFFLVTCSIHRSFPHITILTSGDLYKARSCSLCNTLKYFLFLHHRRRRFARFRLLGLFRFRIYFSKIYEWTVGRTPWMWDQPDARPPPTQGNTTQRNADTHPCLLWNSNSWSQCSGGRRQYVP